MIKAVLIDIDNTLLDFDAYVKNTMKVGFEKYGICEYTEQMFSVFTRVNTALWQELEKGIIDFKELTRDRWNRVFAALGVTFDGQEFEKYFRAALFDSAIPVEGALGMLEYLKPKYTLCVASNGPYAQQLNRIKTGSMYKYFTHFFISEKVGASKPSAEFFSHCIDTLKVDPSEVMMIGDSLSSDIAGAHAFNIHTCFFDKNNTHPKTDIPIDHIIYSLDKIRDIL